MCWLHEGRYGGRAERGMKKALNQGILAAGCGPRAGRVRYPGEVPGLADEEICSDFNCSTGQSRTQVARVIWVYSVQDVSQSPKKSNLDIW